MKFLNRLSKYLMGVLIGLGLTYVMFSERGCTDWLPTIESKRILLLEASLHLKMLVTYFFAMALQLAM